MVPDPIPYPSLMFIYTQITPHYFYKNLIHHHYQRVKKLRIGYQEDSSRGGPLLILGPDKVIPDVLESLEMKVNTLSLSHFPVHPVKSPLSNFTYIVKVSTPYPTLDQSTGIRLTSRSTVYIRKSIYIEGVFSFDVTTSGMDRDGVSNFSLWYLSLRK